MSPSPAEGIKRIVYLWRSIGPIGLTRRIAVKAASPIYQRYSYFIANAYLDTVTVADEPGSEPGRARGRIVDSVDAFDALPGRFHRHIRAEELRRFLEGAPRRFLLLAEFNDPDRGLMYVGYRTCEQGYFEVANARIAGKLPDNYVMIYHNEVVPEYRGRGFAEHSRGALFAHCKKIGVNRITSVIALHNAASLRAQSKRLHGDLASTPGQISSTLWFGGLIVRKTPWEEVLAIVQTPPPKTEPTHDGQAGGI